MLTNQSFDSKLLKDELNRILKTPYFKSSKILSNFLQFIMTQTLNGKGQSPKVYLVSMEVLEKSTDFNPQLDAIVRIHTRRRWKLLEENCGESELNDLLKISIPMDSYIPKFRSNQMHSLTPDNSILEKANHRTNSQKFTILPLTKADLLERLDVICKSLCWDISIELSKFQELTCQVRNIFWRYSTTIQ